ncbi:MAG: dynamin family protein [Pseudomonadota bacterium]
MSRPPPTPAVAPGQFLQDRERIRALIQQGQALAKSLNDPALIAEVDQLSISALKPFLFVVVGEVKSGKSSLVNALLEAPVCAVDSLPCTIKVQEIHYGETAQRIAVSEFEERLNLPHPILQHIAIVDTPGTNAIVHQHQVITEGYLPQSDLVLFVFFAKNPYTGSAWDFLRSIHHDWQRNVLFVLQQCDLLEDGELERTEARVVQQLARENITEPRIFPVSVLTGAGLKTLTGYLRSHVVKGRQFNKSVSLANNLLHFLRRFGNRLQDRQRLIEDDEVPLGELRRTLLDLTAQARQEYQTLLAQAGEGVDAARAWLAGEGVSVSEGEAAGSKKGSKKNTPWDFALTRLPWLVPLQPAVKQVALHWHHLSQSWGRPLQSVDQFVHWHAELNRHIFQAQRYRLDLNRQLRLRLLPILAALEALPGDLAIQREPAAAPWRDLYIASLRQQRDALDGLDTLESEDLMTSLLMPATLAPGEPPVYYSLMQSSAGLSGLWFGFAVGGILIGVLGGVAAYWGMGQAVTGRRQTWIHCESHRALDRGLRFLEQRLTRILLTHPTRHQQALVQTLEAYERDLARHREEIQHLQQLAQGLRAAVKDFRGEAWLAAAQDDETAPMTTDD